MEIKMHFACALIKVRDFDFFYKLKDLTLKFVYNNLAYLF